MHGALLLSITPVDIKSAYRDVSEVILDPLVPSQDISWAAAEGSRAKTWRRAALLSPSQVADPQKNELNKWRLFLSP